MWFLTGCRFAAFLATLFFIGRMAKENYAIKAKTYTVRNFVEEFGEIDVNTRRYPETDGEK